MYCAYHFLHNESNNFIRSLFLLFIYLLCSLMSSVFFSSYIRIETSYTSWVGAGEFVLSVLRLKVVFGNGSIYMTIKEEKFLVCG